MVSLLTDISSESVAAILPIYITVVVGLGPLAFGFIDGIYQGISAFVRIAGGRWADRSDRPKWVAFIGYGLSALTRSGCCSSAGSGRSPRWWRSIGSARVCEPARGTP